MTATDYMNEEEVIELVGKKRTALRRLINDCGFPRPVLTHPKRFSRKAIEKWFEEGGINRGG